MKWKKQIANAVEWRNAWRTQSETDSNVEKDDVKHVACCFLICPDQYFCHSFPNS